MFVSIVIALAATAQAQTQAQTQAQAQAQIWPADPIAYTGQNVGQRIDALEAEVASLRNVGACSTGSCGGCSSASCCDCRNGGLYAGFSFAIAKPHFKEAFQASYFNAGGALNMVPFAYGYDLAPRMWIGYTGKSGLGLRGRYWQYDQSSNPFDSTGMGYAQANVVSIIFPAMVSATYPQTLSVTDGLEVHTVDVEGTQSACIAGMPFVVGGGVRYAMMKQSSLATVLEGGSVVQALSWQRRFEGVGPTMVAEIERPLGNSGLAFVGSFRGSLLFGNKDLDRVEINGSGGGPPVVTLDKAPEVLGIGEIEIGLQWTRQMACGDLFVRGVYEGQLWSDSGSPTLGYLGFEGFALAVGYAR